MVNINLSIVNVSNVTEEIVCITEASIKYSMCFAHVVLKRLQAFT